MNPFAQSVSNIFKGASKAFRTFPASIGCALAFAIVAAIRIQLDWPQQEPYDFLFNCLHWAFAMGAIFSLAAITGAQSRFHTGNTFLIANLLGVAATIATFLGLYLWGGTMLTGVHYATISPLAAMRVCSAMLVSLIVFVLFAGEPKNKDGFTSALFMAHKSFFIALIYGLVILAGTTGVARAIQYLLYHDMSNKVYQYIVTLAGLLTYSIFLGYFPDFRRGSADEHRSAAQKQPRFIEVLFGTIMIPIVLTLTAVLLVWAGTTVFNRMQVSFVQLSSISASYTIGGLWLYAMVAGHESKLAKLYRRVYPIASIVILAFEAWAVINQLQASGLKLTEYIFILIWILAGASCVLLLIMKNSAHRIIALTACILAVFAVLPAVGYHALPVAVQVDRLESLLVGQGMLNEDQLTPAAGVPNESVRAQITDAVDYLANARDAKLPNWFDPKLNEGDVFQTKLGFEMTWIASDPVYAVPTKFLGIYLTLAPRAIAIGDYTWAVNLQNEYAEEIDSATVVGNKGTYQFNWTVFDNGIPSLEILLDNRVILSQNLSDFAAAIYEKYPPEINEMKEADLMDMSLQLENADIRALLVFSRIEINVDVENGATQYWFTPKDLYLKELP